VFTEVTSELRTTETLTEGLILLLVLETMIPFSLTLIPVPPVLGVDPNAPVVQFTLPIVLAAVFILGISIERARRG